MDALYAGCGGIDIHQKSMTVCVLIRRPAQGTVRKIPSSWPIWPRATSSEDSAFGGSPQGRVRALHRFRLQQQLERIDFVDQQIAQLQAEIEKPNAPWKKPSRY